MINSVEIKNNELLLIFENNNFIKIKNLKEWDFSIKNPEIFYTDNEDEESFEIILQNFLIDDRLISKSNISLNISFCEIKFFGDEDEIFLKNNLETSFENLIEEIIKYNYDEQKILLEKEKNKNIFDNSLNILKQYQDLSSESDFNFLISFLQGNYDFEVKHKNQLIKPSSKLKRFLFNFIKDILNKDLLQKGIDANIDCFSKSCILKKEKVIFKFIVEQIGLDHEKKWSVIEFGIWEKI